MVFRLEVSPVERAAALGEYVNPNVVPAGMSQAFDGSPLNEATANLRGDRRDVGFAERITDAMGWSKALDHARQVQQEFGAFTHVPRAHDDAPLLAEASGPLCGVPVAVKDNIAVKGMPLTAGSAVMAGEVAEHDAAVVRRLRGAGALVIGKAALDEFAFGTVGPNIVNPTAPGLTVGGSSGGSAAGVAAGACPVALGTDTGGSVRIPASCTGVVGFKPTGGWVSNHGIVPLSWSLDTVGIVARSVEDVSLVYDALVGEAPAATGFAALEELRVASPDDHYMRVAVDAVGKNFLEVRNRLVNSVACVDAVSLPDSDDSLHVQYLVVLSESASYHRQRWGAELGGYTPSVQSALERGDAVSAGSYLAAQRARAAMRARLQSVMREYDVLIMPTMAIDPPTANADEAKLGDGRVEDVVSAMLRFTALFNHVGFPAISVPLATADGTPRGLQLVGHPGSDAQLLAIAGSVVRSLAA